MKTSAVLFDLDGTLRDTKEVVYGAYQQAIRRHTGRDVTHEDIKPYSHHHTVVHKGFAAHVEFQDFENTYFDLVTAGIRAAKLFEGSETMLKDLQQRGLRLAVVTSARQTLTEEYLEALRLDGYFEVIVGMSAQFQPKPAPDLVQAALSQLNCQPSEAIMVGDTTADVQAAHAADVRCIGITHGFATKDELQQAGADYLIDSLAELPALLKKIA